MKLSIIISHHIACLISESSEQQLDPLIEEMNAPPTEDDLSNVSPHLTPSTISPEIPTFMM